ncbi:MAG: hypothetical protein ACI4V1_01355 [Eubacteriales bacterium]
MNEEMELSIVTLNGVTASVRCDSVHLTARDDGNGRGGGGIGIRRGHAPAMISLDDGDVTAFLEGKIVLRVRIRSGFAAVRRNVVTVLTEHAEVVE